MKLCRPGKYSLTQAEKKSAENCGKIEAVTQRKTDGEGKGTGQEKTRSFSCTYFYFTLYLALDIHF